MISVVTPIPHKYFNETDKKEYSAKLPNQDLSLAYLLHEEQIPFYYHKQSDEMYNYYGYTQSLDYHSIKEYEYNINEQIERYQQATLLGLL